MGSPSMDEVQGYFKTQLNYMFTIYTNKAEEPKTAPRKPVLERGVVSVDSTGAGMPDSEQLQAALAKAAAAEQENAALKSKLQGVEELLRGALQRTGNLQRSESEPRGSALLSYMKLEQERADSVRSLEEGVKEAVQAREKAEREAAEALQAKERAERVAEEAQRAREWAEDWARAALQSKSPAVAEHEQLKSACSQLRDVCHPLAAQETGGTGGHTPSSTQPASAHCLSPTRYYQLPPSASASPCGTPYGTPDERPYSWARAHADGPSFPHVRRALFPPLPAPAVAPQGGVRKLWGACPAVYGQQQSIW